MAILGLTVWDYTFGIMYLLGISLLGVYFFARQKSTKDYFLAGRGMGWLPVGLSLMATLTSAIGYTAQPAMGVRYGLIMIWGLLAIPLSYPIVVYVFMPFYYRLKVYTAYEYLEKRFNLNVRLLTSGIFIIWRITWMATAIYAPSLVLYTVTDGQLPLVPSIIALGILATIYTALGGVKAVIWTDVAQFVIMFSGMIIAAVVIILAVDGGVTQIWSRLEESGRTVMTAQIEGWEEANWLNKLILLLYEDVTVLAIVMTAVIGKLGNYCVDQVMVQRYLTARSLKTGQRAFLANAFAYSFFVIMMTVIGAALFALTVDHEFPEHLAGDQVFPYFMANLMPVGIAGLMVASIYAASMSSLDSGVNSCITALTNDFYNRLVRGRYSLLEDEDTQETQQDARTRLRVVQLASLVLGILVTALACFVGTLGEIFVISQRLIQGFIGPLFGIFLLAMFTRRAHGSGVLLGAFLATILTILTIFPAQLAPLLGDWLRVFDVGFMWPIAIGLGATLVLGYGFSLIIPHQAPLAAAWTWRAVMNDSMQELPELAERAVLDDETLSVSDGKAADKE